MATLLGGLLMFRISGYTLGERRKKSNEAFTNAPSIHLSRWTAAYTSRVLAGGFLVVAAVANIPVARFELSRRHQDQALDKLAQLAAVRGGSVGVQNHKLTSLIAWPDMTDTELRELDLSAVHTLSLADSRVTDAILPELKTGRLFYLDLSRTQLSEQAISQSGISYLRQLTLSAPQFTGKCFATWSFRLEELDLSNSGVTDDTIVYVNRLLPLNSLDLSHTAVTDIGLTHLAEAQLEQLNISDTRITPESVRRLKLVKKIVIAPRQFSSTERLSLEASGVQVQVQVQVLEQQ